MRLAVIAAFCLGAALGDARAQTLQDLLSERLADNPGVRAARAEAEAAGTRIRTARAAGLPQVGAGATYQIGTGDFDPGPNGRALLGSLPAGPEGALPLAGQNGDGQFRAEAAIEQSIFTGLRILNGIRGAKAASAVARARADLAEQRAGLAIVDAYTGLVAAGARLDAAAAAAERFATEAGAAAVRFETGRNTRTDLALAEAQAASARGLLALAEAEVTAARADLSALTGAAPDAPAPPVVPPVPDTAEAAVARALDAAPTVRAALSAAEAAEAALRVAKGARSPQLSARAAALYAEDQFVTGDELTAVTVTAQLSVPIFQGGAIGAGIAEARADARAARFALDDARRAAEAEARTAFARYRAATLAEEAAILRAEASTLAAEGAALEREVGQRNLQDTLAAIALGAEARAGRADAARARVLAAYGLRAAAGMPLALDR